MNENAMRTMLHRAIYELASIHFTALEYVPRKYLDLVDSAEGREIVRDGMKILGLKDLSDDSIVGRKL